MFSFSDSIDVEALNVVQGVIESAASEIIIAFIFLVGTLLASVYYSIRVRCYWWSLKNKVLTGISRTWRHRDRIKGTLDDYTNILEKTRGDIKDYCVNSNDHYEIFVHVFTKQGLSDWPLWREGRRRDDPNKSALEEYYWDFIDFIEEFDKEERAYTPRVKRVIVTDNYDSSTSHEKIEEIKSDLEDEQARESYIEDLHINRGDARIFIYDRPWPTWLSDVVFYGIKKEDEDDVKWLYSISTSYEPTTRSLITLRFRRIGAWLLGKYCNLPGSFDSLVELANSANYDPDQLSDLYILEDARETSFPSND